MARYSGDFRVFRSDGTVAGDMNKKCGEADSQWTLAVSK